MKKELELYIHIPFCTKKCAYCDFLSAAASKNEKEIYVEHLIEEINSYKGQMDAYEVSSIFIGGGTPSSLEEEEIVRILSTVGNVFDIRGISKEGIVMSADYQAEITIECNPGTLSKEKLEAYIRANINRLSIGLQSTNNEELQLLGRIHTYEEFLENYKIAREVGFRNINIDLMSGLPKQTLKTWEETLQKVIHLQPEHISAYSLIIEEGTSFETTYGEEGAYKELLPSEDVDRLMYEVTKKQLEKAGYYRYEISNYSKKGFECRHNVGYWKRKEYLGIGLGASSFINCTRFHNVETIAEYNQLAKDHDRLRREVTCLSQSEEMEEFMFLGLRLSKGVEKKEFNAYFGCDIYDVYKEVINYLIEEGLLIDDGTNLFLSSYGTDVSNQVFLEFLFDEREKK